MRLTDKDAPATEQRELRRTARAASAVPRRRTPCLAEPARTDTHRRGAEREGAGAENVDSTDQADSVGDAILCQIFHCDEWSSERWVKLGEAPIDGLFDHGSFDVDGRAGRVTKLQLRIREGGVNIDSFDVWFRDGSRFSPDFDHHYREGERSNTVELPRPQRIDYVSISGSKEIFGSGSVVELWARR